MIRQLQPEVLPRLLADASWDRGLEAATTQSDFEKFDQLSGKERKKALKQLTPEAQAALLQHAEPRKRVGDLEEMRVSRRIQVTCVASVHVCESPDRNPGVNRDRNPGVNAES